MNFSIARALLLSTVANRKMTALSIVVVVLSGLILHSPKAFLDAMDVQVEETEEQAGPEEVADCRAASLPPISVLGEWPAWLTWAGAQVEPEAATVLVRLAGDEPLRVEVLTTPAADDHAAQETALADAERVRTCLWRRVAVERGKRLDALGVSERPYDAIKIKTKVHKPKPLDIPPGALPAATLIFFIFSCASAIGYTSLPQWRADGFMETLSATPVTAFMLSGGMWLACWLLSLVVSAALLLGWFFGSLMGLDGALSWSTILQIPTACALISALVIFSVRTVRSVREAVFPAMFWMFVAMALGWWAMTVELGHPGLGVLIPIGGALVAFCDIGSPWMGTLSGLISAGLLVVLSTRSLAAEDVTQVDRVDARRALGDFRPEAVLLWLIAVSGTTLWVPGVMLNDAILVTLISFPLFFVLPAVIAPVTLRLPTCAVLSVKRPPIEAMLLAPLIAVGTMCLSAFVSYGQHQLWPTKVDKLLEYAQDMAAFGEGYGVLVITLMPGICEELLFRGALLGLLLRRGRPGAAVVWQAVAFALGHIYLFKFAPTFVLGLAMGWLTLRTRSIWPAMLAHAVHNLLAIYGESIGQALGGPEQLVMAAIAGVVVGGLALWRATRTVPATG